jgi:hypothetical protein
MLSRNAFICERASNLPPNGAYTDGFGGTMRDSATSVSGARVDQASFRTAEVADA